MYCDDRLMTISRFTTPWLWPTTLWGDSSSKSVSLKSNELKKITYILQNIDFHRIHLEVFFSHFTMYHNDWLMTISRFMTPPS